MLEESHTLAREIAAVIGRPKNPLGVSDKILWVRQNNYGEERVVWPLAIDGASFADISLIIDAYPHDRPQRWHLNLIVGARVVGLDYDPEVIHTNINPFSDLPYVIEGPHLHRWEDNQHLCSQKAAPKKLSYARPLPTNVRGFENSLRWFCALTNIILPSGIILALPPRETLL